MKSWPVRELKYHKVGQHKAYWPVSIMHLKVGHQTPYYGRSKNAPPNKHATVFVGSHKINWRRRTKAGKRYQGLTFLMNTYILWCAFEMQYSLHNSVAKGSYIIICNLSVKVSWHYSASQVSSSCLGS